MSPRHCNTKPDKRQQGIRKPIHPPDIRDVDFGAEPQVNPDVQELVQAKTRKKINLEAVSQQVFFSDIEISFERRYAPSQRAIGKHRAGAAVCYAHTPVIAFVGCARIQGLNLQLSSRSSCSRTCSAQSSATVLPAGRSVDARFHTILPCPSTIIRPGVPLTE